MAEIGKLVPRRRFKEFINSGDWEQRRLGEVADIVGGGTPSTSIAEYWDGDIDWYTPAEITDQIYVSSSQKKITEQGFDNSSAKLLPVGTVLFTSRAGIGKTAILVNVGCTNQGFQSIVPHKNELDSYFIFSRTEELKRYGETIGAGSTFVEVSGKQMENMQLMMPKTITEQQVTGTYFKNLDHLITLHQRKVVKIKALKSAYLSEMFPDEGKCKPKRRFKGFTEDWEQCKVSDIVEVMDGDRGKNYPAEIDYIKNGHTLFLNTSNITMEGFSFEDNQYISETKSNGMGNGKLVEDDIVLTSRGSLGHVAWYNADISNKIPYARINSGMLILRKKSDISTAYLYQFLKSDKGQKQISFIGFGSAQPQLTKKGVESLSVIIPKKFNEQERLGEYFNNFDTLIANHQRKLEKLQNIKKAFLNEMFI